MSRGGRPRIAGMLSRPAPALPTPSTLPAGAAASRLHPARAQRACRAQDAPGWRHRGCLQVGPFTQQSGVSRAAAVSRGAGVLTRWCPAYSCHANWKVSPSTPLSRTAPLALWNCTTLMPPWMV